ncbi:uncharacterized protein K452DRAFT_308447 [Aplosporella prunicola CBS 121167]|uniref:Secreted protein n=1 Tax=Aplosporella prunicola CBS 121167 TaxID=1176127 RepID=A0A6A6BHL8_9PEZI|nr:uncharacterized protein K452DRAFT_308447 [Aplosporella prunicola CBS 121167]KAF2142051.1 hypothetical protein K452DRAFT_308447 [Aplosporella prunicola CBS 121167]
MAVVSLFLLLLSATTARSGNWINGLGQSDASAVRPQPTAAYHSRKTDRRGEHFPNRPLLMRSSSCSAHTDSSHSCLPHCFVRERAPRHVEQRGDVIYLSPSKRSWAWSNASRRAISITSPAKPILTERSRPSLAPDHGARSLAWHPPAMSQSSADPFLYPFFTSSWLRPNARTPHDNAPSKNIPFPRPPLSIAVCPLALFP